MASNLAGRAILDQPPRLLVGEARLEADPVVGETWIVLPDEAKELRVPGDRPYALVFDLDFVQSPEDARAYVRRWGLLFTGAGDPAVAGVFREAWSDWSASIRELRRVITLAGYVRRAYDSDAEAMATLRRFPDPSVEGMADDDLLREISRGIGALVTAKLAVVPWALDARAWLDPADGDPTEYLLAARPPNTISYVYFLIADLLAARAPVHRCKGCGRLFRPTHGNSRYHDETCSQRARYQRWYAGRKGRTDRPEGAAH